MSCISPVLSSAGIGLAHVIRLMDERDKAGAVAKTELTVDAFQRFVHGTRTDRQATRDLSIGEPTRHLFNDISFARGQF